MSTLPSVRLPPGVLGRSTRASLVVGTFLTALNQGDALLSPAPPRALLWKIPLTFAVPFLVATYGALARAEAPPKGAPMQKEYAAPSSEKLGTLPPGIGVASGERAPDARVEDADGHPVQLASLWAKGPILVAFYRGGWCPYCNFELHALAGAVADFARRGVTPVAVSVDRAEESAKSRALYAIPFPVLSDPDLKAHRAFRVIHHVEGAELARLKGFSMDLERSSGRAHHDIAIPSFFLVDKSGVVRWAHADPEYKVRPTIAQLLEAIDRAHL